MYRNSDDSMNGHHFSFVAALFAKCAGGSYYTRNVFPCCTTYSATLEATDRAGATGGALISLLKGIYIYFWYIFTVIGNYLDRKRGLQLSYRLTRLGAGTPTGYNHNLRSYGFSSARACIVYFIYTHIGPGHRNKYN